MKKILITGANSYIGTSFEQWVNQWPQHYKVDTLDLIDANWRTRSFNEYDVIYHVAGIAHIKQTKENKDLYYKVNRDLAIDVARKAREDNVRQFVFLSSMSIYGIEQGVITKETIPYPKCHYGKSKYEAEQKLLDLEGAKFIVSILRPPMVYGEGCKGNFVRLNKLTDKISFFPNINNKRSMIHIDNLNEFVKVIIDKEIYGVFCPQNSEYVCTTELIKLLSVYKNKRMIIIPGFQKLITILSKKINIFSKVFGNLVYEQEVSTINHHYQIRTFEDSIKRSI